MARQQPRPAQQQQQQQQRNPSPAVHHNSSSATTNGRVIGDYVLGNQIGAGAYGTVRTALQTGPTNAPHPPP